MAMRVKFEDRLAVIRIKKAFSAPYIKYRYLYLKRKDVQSAAKFKALINKICVNWPPDEYMLKRSDNKVFARFKVTNGKVALLYRTSPSTGIKYPIWDFFKTRSKVAARTK